MRKLLLLLAVPVLALGQVRPPDGVPASGGNFYGPVTGPGFFPPAQDFIFYVDPTGSDANNCTAAITPCLTVEGALEKVPPQWKQKARIIVAAGTVNACKTPTAECRWRFGTPVAAGEPFVIQGAMEDSGLGERTITGVTTYGAGYVVSVTDSTLAPTLDQYEGYFLRMTACAAGSYCVGMTRIIRGNSTGGKFDLNIGTTSTSIIPAVGDKFVIERPASIITYQKRVLIASYGYDRVTMIFNKVRLIGTSTSAKITVYRSNLYIRSVSLYSTYSGLELYDNATLQTAYATGVTTDDIIGSTATYGSGLYYSITNASQLGIYSEASTIAGHIVGRNGGIYAQYGSVVRLANVSLKLRGITVSSGHLAHGVADYGPYGQIIGSAVEGIYLENSSSAPIGEHINDLVISNSASHGIVLTGGSGVYVKKLSGTNNAGSGISVQQGSYLQENTDVTIAGTTSEVLVGAQTTTHAAIAAGTPLIVPPHGTATKYGGTTNYPLSGTNSGDVTLGVVGSTPNVNGATLTGQVWNAQPADATYPGVVTATSQTFAGAKTFTAPITLTPSALGTCGTAPNVEGTLVTVAGATTIPTKMCFCTLVPTGSVYAWQNITGTFATSAASFGNTTTCPDSAL